MKRIFTAFVVLILAGAGTAWAHKSSDAYLTISVSNHVVSVRLDVALRDLQEAIGLDANDDGAITWAELKSRESDLAAYISSRFGARTEGAKLDLAPWRLAVADHTDGSYAVLLSQAPLPASAKSIEVLYHLLFDVDAQHRGLASFHRLSTSGSIDSASFIFSPAATSHGFSFTAESRLGLIEFVREGVHHIWTGYDHILFLLALLLPAVVRREAHGGWMAVGSLNVALREVISVVTAFTIAHSFTLALAASGWLRLPSRWVESAIAASVIVAAFANLAPLRRANEGVGTTRTKQASRAFLSRPWLIAFAFGLIHGFGFASVLGELKMDRLSFGAGLFGFNLGVELGQLAVVAGFIPVAYLLRETWLYRRIALQGGSVAIMAIAGAWLAERAAGVSFMPF
jgi:hypothetical protein